MTPILAFDLETVPDLAGIRRLQGLPADLPDGSAADDAVEAGDPVLAVLNNRQVAAIRYADLLTVDGEPA